MRPSPSGALRDRDWLRRYETGLQDLVDDFYVPALSASAQYDRKAGFFSSSALAVAATGIARLLGNQGHMRLLVGVRLSAEDVEAMQQGYRERDEVVAEALTRDWSLAEDDIARDRLGALAEMIAQGLLEIRVVAPTDEHGNPLSEAEAQGMFHEKSGVFTDADGEQVVFVGSINESETAWRGRNIEHFHVFCSWRDDAEHGGVQVADFERLWEGQHPRALSLPFPEALRQGLLELRPEEPPDHDPLEKHSVRAQAVARERELWTFQFLRDAPLLENGPALVESMSAITPWPHQRRVYQRACADFPHRWHMLCDEVGLGKTIEAGLILRCLMLPGLVRRVLLLVPKSLIKQWQQELREKFNLWAYWYTGHDFVDPIGNRAPSPANGWDADYPIIIASSHLARRRGRMEELLAAREWDLVLVDEAHHARRAWGPGGERRANRMLRLMDGLRERTRGLQMMTATPMQVDVRELWELLRLCGMDGRWAEHWGDDFSRYFLTLRHDPWSRDDLSFLLQMTQAYFAAGGQADERLRDDFRQQPGGFILWSQLTSALTSADPARIEECSADRGMRDLVGDFLRRHTPVRDFMFRHTRGTLRQYRARGLLNASIPTREVSDRFIPLGSAQECYDRIEEYISDKYRKAELERRRALGYVMTIYRQRLTSSPWAISQTLRKRLEQNLAMAEDEVLDDEEPDVLDEDVDEAVADEGPLDAQALQEEIAYIEGFLRDLQALGVDPKLRRLLSDLQDLRAEHPQAVIFTQYTDTMDFLRDELAETYGSQVACYSGRGGERWDTVEQRWAVATKEDIKAGFADRRYSVLVCTEAASEGLNLQTSDLLINYDMPWNPMRVEQRIGRIDRIGQASATVRIINYYYEGSVEARIYQVLRERLDIFRTAVGPMQPVLGDLAKRIERAAMASPTEREPALEGESRALVHDIEVAKLQGIDVDELTEAIPAAPPAQQPPCGPEDVRDALADSEVLSRQWTVSEVEPGIYELTAAGAELQHRTSATFRQDILESRPDTVEHCLAWGDPVFERLLATLPAPAGSAWGQLRRKVDSDGRVSYEWDGDDGSRAVLSLTDLQDCLAHITVPPDAD